MLHIQKNQKTIKSYSDPYSLADDLADVIQGIPAQSIDFIKKNAFALCIKGAKVTLGRGWRIISE